MSEIARLAQIRSLMFDIETEAGLTEISGLEREVLLACADLINTKEFARTKDILSHRFLTSFSRPSVFRALKSLVNQELLFNGKGLRGSYRLGASDF